MSTQNALLVPRSSRVFSYDAAHAPAATVAPGEPFVVETMSAFGEFRFGPEDDLANLPEEKCDPLTGPIAVRGAMPGDVLEVHIDHIELEGAGVQGILPEIGALDWPTAPPYHHAIIDGAIAFPQGVRIPIRPNLGCIGLAPLEGPVKSVLPGDHGGNIDTRWVCPGSVVELPVHHPGGLLFMGDCHQRQGDGEICGVAPETDALVSLRCTIRTGAPIPRPRIRTATHLMFLASAETLEQANAIATQDAIEAVAARGVLDPEQSYLWLTIAADLEIGQIVNALKTVRVSVPLDLLAAVTAG